MVYIFQKQNFLQTSVYIYIYDVSIVFSYILNI